MGVQLSPRLPILMRPWIPEGTPPSRKGQSVIRRQRPIQKRKSGLELLRAGAPSSQTILGCRPLQDSASPNILKRYSHFDRVMGPSMKGYGMCRSRNPSPSSEGKAEDMELVPELKRHKTFASHSMNTMNTLKPAVSSLPKPFLTRSVSSYAIRDPAKATAAEWETEYGARPDGQGRLTLPLKKVTSTKVRETITADTLASVLKDRSHLKPGQRVVLVDCRFPAEFGAGSIQGAEHFWLVQDVQQRFFAPAPRDDGNIYVFFCEFSQKRGPRMWKKVRSTDRTLNGENFPKCHYPEMYLLEEGYKNFFLKYPVRFPSSSS